MKERNTGTVELDNIQIASPCSADWNQMSGDERVRHCALCRKNVYNLSSMTRAEAEALIMEKEGRCCVRFYRRADGTMLTDNCPVGVRALRRRLRWMATGIAALFTFGLVYAAKASVANGSFSIRTLKPVSSLQNIQPFKQMIDWIDPPVQMVMGTLPPPATMGRTSLPPASTSGSQSQTAHEQPAEPNNE